MCVRRQDCSIEHASAIPPDLLIGVPCPLKPIIHLITFPISPFTALEQQRVRAQYNSFPLDRPRLALGALISISISLLVSFLPKLILQDGVEAPSRDTRPCGIRACLAGPINACGPREETHNARPMDQARPRTFSRKAPGADWIDSE